MGLLKVYLYTQVSICHVPLKILEPVIEAHN
uniref:Uncharacterized protein n=1 Tax=Anguilla anguilla TaxID=7936 RepID=A0A0E9R4N4_ANGAN